MKAKYGGTTTYIHVLAELVRAAQYGGLTTYQDIAVIMGLPTRGSFMGAECRKILSEISENEAAEGRPMLSAVAVSIDGKPGPGFFKLARQLGCMLDGEADAAFWARERKRVYAAWKRPIPKK